MAGAIPLRPKRRSLSRRLMKDKLYPWATAVLTLLFAGMIMILAVLYAGPILNKVIQIPIFTTIGHAVKGIAAESRQHFLMEVLHR